MIEQRPQAQTLDDYWAKKPTAEFGPIVKRRVDDYRMYCQTSGRMDIWRRSLRTYFGLDADGGWRNTIAVTFSGDDGENVEVRANLYRMFVRARAVLATGTRPTYSCRPRAYDGDATEKVSVGNAICEMYLDRDLEPRMMDTLVNAITTAEGWSGALWDPYAGPVTGVDEETGHVGHEGDVEFPVFRPDEVVRDIDVPGDDHDWIIVRRRRSRWTMAQRYPAHATHILAAPSWDADATQTDLRLRSWGAVDRTQHADQVTTWEFYHRPTDLMPEGRATIVVDGVAVGDGPNPYKKIPIRSLIPSREPDSAWGYSDCWDLLALSQVFDSVITQVATTRENYGLQNFVTPPNSSVTVEALSKGSRLLHTSVAPIPIDQSGNAVESGIAMLGFLQGLMQALMSQSDASLGNAGSSPSGASLSMQMQLSAQNNAGLVRAFLQFFQQIMGDTIECLKMFATTERVVHIAGKNNAPKVERFMGSDLEALSGIDVELGSAEMRTTQMRHQIVTELLGANLITSPEQALQMMSTGRLEPAFNGPAAREVCIERENEALQNGERVPVMDQDFHADHIARHAAIIADPKTRANVELFSVVQAHLYEHAARWSAMTMDPTGMGQAFLAATGQQPCPMPVQPGMAAPPPGATPQGAPVPNPQEAPGQQAEPSPGPPGPTGNPGVTDPTTNPATGPALPPDARPIPTTY